MIDQTLSQSIQWYFQCLSTKHLSMPAVQITSSKRSDSIPGPRNIGSEPSYRKFGLWSPYVWCNPRIWGLRSQNVWYQTPEYWSPGPKILNFQRHCRWRGGNGSPKSTVHPQIGTLGTNVSSKSPKIAILRPPNFGLFGMRPLCGFFGVLPSRQPNNITWHVATVTCGGEQLTLQVDYTYGASLKHHHLCAGAKLAGGPN